MTTLQKKENKFLWITKSEEIFQNIKQLLMNAPILWIVDLDGDFVVFIVARKEGLRGFLLQNDYAICYESQKLNEHKQKYPTHDLESVAIIHALKMWRHYLMGKKLLMNIENMSLKYLFEQPDLNVRQADGWISLASTISS